MASRRHFGEGYADLNQLYPSHIHEQQKASYALILGGCWPVLTLALRLWKSPLNRLQCLYQVSNPSGLSSINLSLKHYNNIWYFSHRLMHSKIHCLTKTKSRTLIFSWTAFSFDHSTHSSCHRFDKLMQCHDIYFCWELHWLFVKILYSWSLIHGIVEPLKSPPADSKDSQRSYFLVANPCMKMIPRAPWTTLSIWAQWILALSSWSMLLQSEKEKVHWCENLVDS